MSEAGRQLWNRIKTTPYFLGRRTKGSHKLQLCIPIRIFFENTDQFSHVSGQRI